MAGEQILQTIQQTAPLLAAGRLFAASLFLFLLAALRFRFAAARRSLLAAGRFRLAAAAAGAQQLIQQAMGVALATQAHAQHNRSQKYFPLHGTTSPVHGTAVARPHVLNPHDRTFWISSGRRQPASSRRTRSTQFTGSRRARSVEPPADSMSTASELLASSYAWRSVRLPCGNRVVFAYRLCWQRALRAVSQFSLNGLRSQLRQNCHLRREFRSGKL